MTKTILCAVDINRVDAENAVLKTAAELANLHDAQLDVITVVPDFGMSVVGAYFQDHHVKSAQNDASDLLKAMTLKSLGADADGKVRHIVAMGTAYEEVLRAAELNKADLIVIGAGMVVPGFILIAVGVNGLMAVLLVSTAMNIIIGVLYLYADEGTVPKHFDADLFKRAFAHKQRCRQFDMQVGYFQAKEPSLDRSRVLPRQVR